MKVNRANKVELAARLTDIANNVARTPVFVVLARNGAFDILNYYSKDPVLVNIPSKSLAVYVCDSFNKRKSFSPFSSMQQYVNTYAKHYYDCEFYKNTIRNTNDSFKRSVTVTRLDISIEYLKQAASYIRKSC
jgi:hypothetical protein